jgi:hypothetical protein
LRPPLKCPLIDYAVPNRKAAKAIKSNRFQSGMGGGIVTKNGLKLACRSDTARREECFRNPFVRYRIRALCIAV